MDENTYIKRFEILKKFTYLPLFYLIPDEIAIARKLDNIPRDPMVIATDKYWEQYFLSSQILVLIADTWCWMMWQHLGIRGGFDNYSINDPFVQLCADLSLWVWLLAEIGIDILLLASYPEGREVPFLSMEMAALNCDKFANVFWNHPFLNLRKAREIIETHRSHDDYSDRNSHVKIDFYRSYYHTRSKTKVLELDADDTEVNTASLNFNAYADVEYQIWLEDFLKQLQPKDVKIIRLLEYGYTQVEIAKILGYANHSGVSKRIKHIRTEFIKYKQKENK